MLQCHSLVQHGIYHPEHQDDTATNSAGLDSINALVYALLTRARSVKSSFAFLSISQKTSTFLCVKESTVQKDAM